MLKKLLWLLGDPDRSQEYTHHILLLVGCLLHLGFALFNTLFLETEPEFNLILIAASVILIVIFYFSRFKGQFFIMSLLFLVVVNLMILPANWFYNGGSAGPTLLLYLISAFYLNFLLADYPKSRYFFMVLVLVIPAVLVFSEPSLTEWIYRYPSEEAKQLDLWVSYIVTVGISVLIMNMYGKRFRLEQEKSERLAQQLKILAETDSLTQLYNRSAFSQLYHQLDDKENYSLALLDLDHFKLLNDAHGHPFGDSALVAFAHQLKNIEVGGKILSRHGGEEFLVLLKSPLMQAFATLDAFRETLDIQDPTGNRLTFSAGLVSLKQDESMLSATQRADIQLYKAKASGRNRVCLEAKT